MKPVLLRFLQSPCCREELRLTSERSKDVQLTPEERKFIQHRGLPVEEYETEITDGSLSCASCGANYLIDNGLPRLVVPVSTDVLTKKSRSVRRTFQNEWDVFDYSKKYIWHWDLEDRLETLREELSLDSLDALNGKFMLDAGCGSGILSMTVSQRYQVEVIAMDLTNAVEAAYRHNKSNLCHFIQGSVLQFPLKPSISDITYSHGVLHHTPSTVKAFEQISQSVKEGGLLYVWLYGKKRGWNRLKYIPIRSIRFFVSRFPDKLQEFAVSLLVMFHRFTRSVKRLFGFSVLKIESISQFRLVVRDRYTPKYAREHTENEIKSWFEKAGYSSVSRRTQWNSVKVWNGSTDHAIRGTRTSAVEALRKIA